MHHLGARNIWATLVWAALSLSCLSFAHGRGSPGSVDRRARLGERRLAKDTFGRCLIPEVIGLADGQRIPAEVYRRYDSRTIGESLVHRLTKTRQRPRQHVPRCACDISKRSEIQLYVGDKAARRIVASDEILNIHQARAFYGNRDIPGLFEHRSKQRGRLEDHISGIVPGKGPPYDPKSPATVLRPKSAMLHVALPSKFPLKTSGDAQFGEISLVMKPSVSRRVSFTCCSSEAMDPVNNPFTRRDPSRVNREVRTMDEKTFYRFSEHPVYLEAMIWGKLDLRDVKEILVPSGLAASTLASLRAAGLPIWTYRVSTKDGRYQRVRKTRVYKGDATRMRAYDRSLTSSRRASTPGSSSR